MRKFKFMSKAVVGMMAVAMTMGSLSGVAAMQPIGVYAAAGDVTISGTGVASGAVSIAQGKTLQLTATTEEGDEDTLTYTWSVSEKPNGVTDTKVDVDSDGVLTVAKDATAGTYKIKATNSATPTAGEGEITVTVQERTVTGITITATGLTNKKISVEQGSTTAFSATVVGSGDGFVGSEEEVVWTVTNPSSVTGSKVSYSSGNLVVAANADEGDYSLTAKSVYNETITDTVTVTVTKSEGGEETTPTPDPGTTTETTAVPDYTTYTLDITGDPAAKYAFLEVWKLEKDATNFNTAANSKDKLSNTYSYELTNGTVTVDLSFLKAGTVQALKVYTDKNTTKKPIILGAQPGKLSGLKYNSATKAFDISKAKEGKTALTTFDQTLYEYRGQYGSTWTPLEEIIDVDHISAGSTIIIRKEATASAPAGPEAKVKISAAGKAPKVTLDYKKGTIKLSEKLEYAGNGKAYANGTKDAMTLETLRTNLGVTDPTQELVVYVRTKEDTGKGKAASNATCVIIPGEEVLADTNSTIAVAGDTENKVTYAADTKGSGKSAKPIYKFTVKGSGFEFTTVATGDRKWKAVGDGKDYTVDQTEAAQTVYIRKAGVKGKAKDGSDSFFPSKEITVTVPAKSADTGDKATKPAAGSNAGEVKVGGEVVLTIGRDQTTNTTINFTVTQGKQSVVDTLEYKIGTGEYAPIPSAPLTNKGTAEITVQVRVKKTDDMAASDPLDVVIAAVSGEQNPAQKMDTPTIVVATGKVSVGSDEVATISRDATDNLIKIVAATDKNDVIEYSVDSGTTWANVTGNVSVADSSAITSVQLRTKAADSKDASDALTVGVPKNLASSEVAIARKAEVTEGTTIVFTVDSSITTTLEYQIGSEAWAEIPSNKEVASVATTQLEIKVRVKAVDSTAKSLASNALTITVPAK